MFYFGPVKSLRCFRESSRGSSWVSGNLGRKVAVVWSREELWIPFRWGNAGHPGNAVCWSERGGCMMSGFPAPHLIRVAEHTNAGEG